MTINRRDFLGRSLTASAVLSLSSKRRLFASGKIAIGAMGIGGQGTWLVERFAEMPEVEIAYLCDVDERRFEKALEGVEAHQKRTPKTVKDFRRILDDPTVDALVNATPDHWHALPTIMACQAGKDVYVEKPLSHNIFEGKKMVEAARKYERVVQVGTQTRSSQYVSKAVEYIRGGGLGDIYLVRVNFMMQHPAEKKGPETAVPEGLDWDMWCGPAPKAPYSPGRWWFNRWDYSCGGIAGDAVHQLDLARLLLNLRYPSAVQQVGGINFFQDGRETPDTQVAIFEYGKLNLIFQAALWTPYMKKTPANIRDGDMFPDWPFNGTKVEIYGTKGFMNFGRQGGGWQAYDQDGRVMSSEYGRQGDIDHIKNFLRCIQTRQQPTADVEEGHVSALLCHLANISYRLGNRKLKFDSVSQRFVDDEEANRYLKRENRDPWIIPDKV